VKSGLELPALVDEIERQAQSKRDWCPAPARAMKMTLEDENRFRMRLDDGGDGIDLGMTDQAHRQVASRVAIPWKYADRMRQEDPDLLVTNVNRWLERDDRSFMLRSLDGDMRALLSDRYRALDNYDLAQAILPPLAQGAGGLKVESCQITPHRLYLKAITDRVQGEVKVGQVVQAGVVISNSEIGLGSLRIEPLVYELACTNGMIVQDYSLRRSHVGRRAGLGDQEFASEFFSDETRQLDDAALWAKARDTVRAVIDQSKFDVILNRLREAAERETNPDKPVEVVQAVAKRFNLTETEQTGVLRAFLTQEDWSAWGVSRAITNASQSVEDYDRATDLERMGSQVLELPKADWSQIAKNN